MNFRTQEESDRVRKVIDQTKEMRSVSKDIRAISREIVERSKNTAHVDTGRLKRSISYVIDLNGIPTFTEVFYGQFNDNSDLEKNIRLLMPNDVAWKLIYTDDNGQPYDMIRKTPSGRMINSTATKATTRKSLGIEGIKNFLKKFTDGEKTNEVADIEQQDNKEES